MATMCRTCNALIEEGRLAVIGIAPFEKYYLLDGTFIGWGYDPTPFNPLPRVPHVGQGDGSGKVCDIGPIWGNAALT